MLFIQPVDISYPSKSEDPIFPADFSFPLHNRTYWISSLKHSTILGCVDEYEICDPNGKPRCWNGTFISQEQSQLGTDPAFRGSTLITSADFSHTDRMTFLTVQLALIQSNTYNSIRMRCAGALDAQGRNNEASSTALQSQQWKLELEKIFRVSLARAQVELVNIASGTWSKTPGFVDFITPFQKQYICGMIKVQTNDKSGVSFGGLIMLFSICSLVAIASFTRKEKVSQENKFVVLIFARE